MRGGRQFPLLDSPHPSAELLHIAEGEEYFGLQRFLHGGERHIRLLALLAVAPALRRPPLAVCAFRFRGPGRRFAPGCGRAVRRVLRVFRVLPFLRFLRFLRLRFLRFLRLRFLRFLRLRFLRFLRLRLGFGAFGLGLAGGGGARGDAAEGRLEVEDVAQQAFAALHRARPFGERVQGERVFPQGADHHLAARLDAFGDGDLALAREQLHRPHFAHIHAHRVVGASEFGVVGVGDGGLRGPRRALFLRLLAFLRLDDVDAEFGDHRHGVFDLFRRHPIRRQRRVDVVIGDVSTLAPLRDHALDRHPGGVDERRVAALFARAGFLGRDRRRFRHARPPPFAAGRFR